MNQEIEQVVIVSSSPTSINEALDYLAQSTRLFRGDTSEFPSGDESPVSATYHLEGHDVLVASSQPGRIVVQVQTDDIRRAYLYDVDSSHPVIINEFADPTSDTPTASFAPTATPDSVSLIVDICDYINRARTSAVNPPLSSTSDDTTPSSQS